MALRRTLSVLLTLAAVLVVGSLVVGQLLGQPVGLSYVETGSMAPTLAAGDGFVAVPPALAGSVEAGDVVVFDAEELNGGGLVTHRVVGETESGYITKGDANTFTDQDDREPPVAPDQIRAVALSVNGELVVVPHLGSAVLAVQEAVGGVQRTLAAALGTRLLLGTQGVAYLLLAVGLVAYAGSTLLERRRDDGRRRRPTRDDRVYDTRTVVLVLTLGVVVLATGSMVAPSGPQTIDVVSSSADSPRPGVVRAGTTENITYTVRNEGYLPTVGFFESRDERLELDRKTVFVPAGGADNVSATITAPPRTGLYRYTLDRHWYLAVLPRGVLAALYGVHPWLPILLIDALFAVGFGTLAAGIVGFGRHRIRTRDRPPSGRFQRLYRWLR